MLLMPFSFAQENTVLQKDGEIIEVVEEEKDYYMEETDEGIIFVQKLTWDESEYALRYNIIIEKQTESGVWEEVDTFSTDTNSLEVSLFAGTYRYKILVYNLLDRLELETEWFEFIILQAMQPIIEDFSPALIYLDEENTGLFRLEGENFLEDTIFTLELPNFPERTLIGTLVEIDDKRVEVQFDIDAIDVGNYTFITKNPGGLTGKIDPFVVNFLKPYDLNVTLGYTVAWTPPSDISKLFDTAFLPLGFSARITFIPVKKTFGSFGVELSVYGFRMQKEVDTYEVSANVLPFSLNFVYQLPIIKKRLVLDTHAGIGLTLFHDLKFDFGNDIVSPPQNVFGVTANVGASLQFYLLNRFYIEAGADYMFTVLMDAVFQMVTPSISVGWQF